MDGYQQYIAKSRYCRYIDEENRREHWHETVSRYLNFMDDHLREKHLFAVPRELRKELLDAIVNLDVVPSMRAIMTAGDALARQNVAGYNCSYLPIDDPKAFDEAMYILLCGTGVGFSVEKKYIDQLPEVPEQLFPSRTTIVVSDSKEGWAKGLRQVLALLYAGEIPTWDLSKVRPAGARLKTFGGRASGPAPLDELFAFCVNKFTSAVGRRLSALECHDIMCKIGEVVVVGGVRRSAMISLSDLTDDTMAHAKTGNWWDGNVQRALANNSAVYESTPPVGQFMREWTAIYESHSGERGIFNRDASRRQVKSTGMRDPDYAWGTNPCSEIILRPYQFCNLSEVIVRSTDTLDDLKRKVGLATILGTFQSTLTHFPYLRKVWQKNTEEERLLGVSLTGIFDHLILGSVSDEAKEFLSVLREHSHATNLDFSNRLGINPSTAITCVKPSGTVSQLTDTASGLHPRHSAFYIRRVRGDKKDPLSQHMVKAGIPVEDCVNRPDSTYVFSFPKRAPAGARTRHDVGPIEHLELWLQYQRYWCDHKPSVTISIEEQAWPAVGAWVYKHFNEVTGVSFLPLDGGTYRQAPYEDITEEEYFALLEKMPANIDWTAFKEFDDAVEGAQQLACTAGSCEI